MPPNNSQHEIRVGLMLSLIGRCYRALPYFRGKWRLINFVFEKYQRTSQAVETITFGPQLKMKCALRDEVQNNIWWLGDSYEVGETRFLKRILKPGMIFYDVGSNVGYYSLIAARLVQSSGCVHAFEPVSRQFEGLRENIDRNQLTNIIPNRLIVSDTIGQMTIHLGPPDNSGKASVVNQVGLSAESETVRATTLDAYVRLQSNPAVNAIKIDTEGHELSVLRGATNVLSLSKPLLLVEVKNRLLQRAGTNRDELFQFLQALGYKSFFILRNGSLREISVPTDGKLIAFIHPSSPFSP